MKINSIENIIIVVAIGVMALYTATLIYLYT